jgi:hypothetical protein
MKIYKHINVRHGGQLDDFCIQCMYMWYFLLSATPSSPGCVSIESTRGGVGSVNFEVISTDTVKEGRSSHVVCIM